MSELREYCIRHKVDIACIQEPAIRYGKLVSVPAANTREYYIFHSKDSMAAIIILNRNLVVTKMNQGTETHLLTIELLLNRKNFYIINQYCQFSEPVEDHTSKLSNMHILAKKHNIVYCRYKCEIEPMVLINHRSQGRNCRRNTVESRIPNSKWTRTTTDISGIHRQRIQHRCHSTKRNAQEQEDKLEDDTEWDQQWS